MKSRIIDIAKRSKDYMSRFDANAIEVIESKPISDKLVDINRDQFAKHKDANDKPLTHKSTGKTTLTQAYRRRTGKSKPDLLLTGEFQDKMLFTMPNISEYFISSRDSKTGFLSNNYGDIFGVAKSNQDKAKQITDKAILKDYKESVFK